MSNLVKLTNTLATRFGMDADGVMATLKQTAFKGQVSDAQMTALLIVANQYGLNPWTKEIYAFPDKQNGIVPVVGVDGWARIINEHPEFDGMEFEQDDESCTCILYRKDRSRAIKVTEYMSECKRGTGPWQSHPKRMLRHKAMIQCSRIAFGFAGIYDQDEAERIVDMGPAERLAPAAAVIAGTVADDYPAYEAVSLQFLKDAAIDGTEAMRAAYRTIPKSANKEKLWTLHGDSLTRAAAEADLVMGSAQPVATEAAAEEESHA